MTTAAAAKGTPAHRVAAVLECSDVRVRIPGRCLVENLSFQASGGQFVAVLGENIKFLLRHYKPSPMSGPQREFH